MKHTSIALSLVATICGSVLAAQPEPTIAEVSHWQLQAVDEYGVATYSPANGSEQVIVSGILLNNPEEILNPTPSGIGIGGQWQIFIQGETDPNGQPDHAGTAVWFGQNYLTRGGNGNYTYPQMVDELHRINRDPNTAYIFQAGDRIRVSGFYRFYGGKLNINEQHNVADAFNFKVELLTPAVGLPQPEIVTLPELKDAGNNFIFDASRLTGPEYHQARLVRLNNVMITTPQNWGPSKSVTVQDENNLTFPVKLGIGSGFSRYPCPEGPIDVIGIMNQESNSGLQGMNGYEIWVVNYDGNGRVLTDRGRPRGNLPGDVNGDFKVDLQDFLEWAENWLTERAGLYSAPIPME
jgi:hypothetical protein